MKKFEVTFLMVFTLALLMPMALLAQEATAVEIDVEALLAGAEAIFITGVGGLSVMALISVIKRWIKAQGIAVIFISILVSAGATLAYLIPVGFILWKFLVYTALVALAARGIYLFPQKRTS